MSELRVKKDTFLTVAKKLENLANVTQQEFGKPLGVRYALRTSPSVFCARLDKYNALTCITRHWAEGKTSLFYYSEEDFTEMQKSCEHYSNYGRKTISIFQLLKSLQCIHYNLNIEGWGNEIHLTEAEKTEYKAVCRTLESLISVISMHIISYDERYREAEWG